jgi:hypothetical protein
LINMRGEAVGVNSAIIGPNGGNVGIGLAVPSRAARQVVERISGIRLPGRERLLGRVGFSRRPRPRRRLPDRRNFAAHQEQNNYQCETRKQSGWEATPQNRRVEVGGSPTVGFCAEGANSCR